MASEEQLSDEAIAQKIGQLHAQLERRNQARNPRPDKPQVTFKIDPLDPDLQAVVDAGANHGVSLNTLILLQLLREVRKLTKPAGPAQPGGTT